MWSGHGRRAGSQSRAEGLEGQRDSGGQVASSSWQGWGGGAGEVNGKAVSALVGNQ